MGRLGGVINFSIDDGDLYRCVELFCLIREKCNLKSVTQKQAKRLQSMVKIGKYKKFGIPSFKTIKALEKDAPFRIKIWTTARNSRQLGRKRVLTPFREPFQDGDYVENVPIIHIYGNDLKRNGCFTKNLSLVYDHEIFFAQKEVHNFSQNAVRLKKTLFQAVVLEKYKTLTGPKFERKVKELEALWGAEIFDISVMSEIKRFQTLFKTGLEIWSFEYIKEGDRKRRYSTLVYKSPLKDNVAIELEDFDIYQPIPIKVCLTYIPDTTKINYYACKTKKCLFGTSRKYNYDRHVATCSDESKISCQQVKIETPENLARESLARDGIIPSKDFQNFYYAVYDVESLMTTSKTFWETRAMIHRLATVAVVSHLDTDDEKFFYRRDMTPSSLKFLVQEFWEHLEQIKKRMHSLLPETIHTAFTAFLDLRKTDNFKKSSPDERAFINKKVEILRKIRTLRVYAWNGTRYDSNILLSPLIEHFSKDEMKFSKMSVIKRNSGYMHVAYDGIHLLG